MFYGLPAPPGPSPEELRRVLEAHRPAYAVQMPRAYGEESFRRWLDALRAARPGQVERVYADPADPRFVIYRLRRGGKAP